MSFSVRITSFRKLLDTCVNCFGNDARAEFEIVDDLIRITVYTDEDVRTARRNIYNFVSKEIANRLVLTLYPKSKLETSPSSNDEPYPSTENGLTSVQSAAKRLGVTPTTIRNMVNRGSLSNIKVEGVRRILISELNDITKPNK